VAGEATGKVKFLGIKTAGNLQEISNEIY